jgi:alpha-L-fucosidase
MQAQILSESREWPDPTVLKITNVRPALMPPGVETVSVKWDANTQTVKLEGRVTDMGKAAFLEVGFQYQVLDSYDLHLRGSWKAGEFLRLNAPGPFTLKLPGLKPGMEVVQFSSVGGRGPRRTAEAVRANY